MTTYIRARCRMDGCAKVVKARGLCEVHYGRERRAGRINQHKSSPNGYLGEYLDSPLCCICLEPDVDGWGMCRSCKRVGGPDWEYERQWYRAQGWRRPEELSAGHPSRAARPAGLVPTPLPGGLSLVDTASNVHVAVSASPPAVSPARLVPDTAGGTLA